MTAEQRKKMEALVVERLRGEYLREEGGEFFGEIYADYRDEIDGRTAGEIIDEDEPEQAFWEKLEEWYRDAEWDYKDELAKKLMNSVGSNEELFPDGLDAEQEGFIEDTVRERVSYSYPADHYLKQDMYVNIMLDTGDCNYDFVLNGSVYPCWYGGDEHILDPKAAIVWLGKQQGYTKTQLQNALKDGDMANPKGFLQSMRVELANLPSHMSTLTFLVRMTFRQLLELNDAMKWRDKTYGRLYDTKKYPYCGYIVLGKETMCGLYDPWAGGGSVLEVQLEKDVRLPVKYIWLAIPDEAKGHGYQIGDVYGMCGSAWQDTLKEMHFPKKMKETS